MRVVRVLAAAASLGCLLLLSACDSGQPSPGPSSGQQYVWPSPQGLPIRLQLAFRPGEKFDLRLRRTGTVTRIVPAQGQGGQPRKETVRLDESISGQAQVVWVHSDGQVGFQADWGSASGQAGDFPPVAPAQTSWVTDSTGQLLIGNVFPPMDFLSGIPNLDAWCAPVPPSSTSAPVALTVDRQEQDNSSTAVSIVSGVLSASQQSGSVTATVLAQESDSWQGNPGGSDSGSVRCSLQGGSVQSSDTQMTVQSQDISGSVDTVLTVSAAA